MKIGVDASCWANKRGYGRYTRELLGTLLDTDKENEYRFFLDSETAEISEDLPQDVEKVVVGTSKAATRAAAASGRRSVQDLWAMRRAVHRHGQDLDVFFFPSVYTYFPIKTRAKVIVTIHDTTAEKYPKLIFPNWSSRMFWKIKVQLAVRRADLITTVSEASKREIVREFRVSPELVRVVSDAVGPEFSPVEDIASSGEILASYGVSNEERFILYVGGISPHKNLETLVDAHAALIREPGMDDVKLVLVGDYQEDVFYSCYAGLCERIHGHGSTDNVVFTGFASEESLSHFYSRASAVVMPSFDEGFGLPALEAMACGTPVVASRAGALPEVVGEAGMLFDPSSADELRTHLSSLLGDAQLLDMMAARALVRAKTFTWENSVQSALEAFRDVTGQYQAALA